MQIGSDNSFVTFKAENDSPEPEMMGRLSEKEFVTCNLSIIKPNSQKNSLTKY